MANKIQIKRGNKSETPLLSNGEIAINFYDDSLYIGKDTENLKFYNSKKIDDMKSRINANHIALSRIGRKYVNMGDTYTSIQGMTYLNDDIIVCAYATDKTGNMTRLDKINIKTGTVLLSSELALGHANCLCYDGEFIYIAMTTDYTLSKDVKTIIKVNKDTLQLVSKFDLNTTLACVGGLAYDNKTQQFFVTSFESVNNCEVYTKSFQKVKTITLKQETYNETGYQIIACNDGKIYQVTINPETIYEFTVDGELLAIYNIDEYYGVYKVGEIQGLGFREDGRCYIRSVAKVSRLSNGIEQYWITDFKTNVNIFNMFASGYGLRSDITMTVDKSTNHYNPSGTLTSPFNSLEEMILSLKSPFLLNENVVVNISGDFQYNNLYLVGVNNKTFYINNNKVNAIKLLGCLNVNVYDYEIVGFMDDGQLQIEKSIARVAGGKITKNSGATYSSKIHRSDVIADSSSIGITSTTPNIIVNTNSRLSITDRNNKTHDGVTKDVSSQINTVRLVKGVLSNSSVTLPSDYTNYNHIEVRYKFPRGYGVYKWIDLTTAPRLCQVFSNADGMAIYDGWFNFSGNVLSSGGTRGVTLKSGSYTYETPTIEFDVALYD